MEERIAQVITQSKSAIRELKAKAELEVEKLQKMKRDMTEKVESALEEVERTLKEDEPQLKSHYGPVARHLTEYSRDFQLFSFQIQTSPQPQVTLITTLQDTLPIKELAQVTSTTLRFFNTSTWGPSVNIRTPIQADGSSIWVILEDGRVFSSGGCIAHTDNSGQVRSSAYLLERDGAVKQLPNMLAGRNYHGVIQIRDIYVFGGGKF